MVLETCPKPTKYPKEFSMDTKKRSWKVI